MDPWDQEPLGLLCMTPASVLWPLVPPVSMFLESLQPLLPHGLYTVSFTWPRLCPDQNILILWVSSLHIAPTRGFSGYSLLHLPGPASCHCVCVLSLLTLFPNSISCFSQAWELQEDRERSAPPLLLLAGHPSVSFLIEPPTNEM